MQIKGPSAGLDGTGNRSSQVRSDSGSKPQSSSGQERRGSEVSLSAVARALPEMEAKIRDLPDVNEARVESIRRALAGGTYVVNAARVAEQFMALETELVEHDK